MNKRSKFALGTGLAVSLISTTAIAANPFQANKMTTGYNTQAPATITKTSSHANGQCGAGRCGSTKPSSKDAGQNAQLNCTSGKCSDIKKKGLKMSPNEKPKQDCNQYAPKAAMLQNESLPPPTSDIPQAKDSAGKCGAGRCG